MDALAFCLSVGLSVVAGAGAGLLVRRHLSLGTHRRGFEKERPQTDPRWPVVAVAVSWPGLLFAPLPQGGSLATPVPVGADGSIAPARVVVVAALWLATAVLVWLVAVDIDVHRLPNAVTLPAIPVSTALLGLCSWAVADGAAWGRSVLGGVAMASGYSLIYLVGRLRGGLGMGLGDVKLAVSLGQWVGWFGWWPLVLGSYAALALGGLHALLALAAGRAGRTTALPHAPAMAAGACVGCCLAPAFAG